MNPRFPIGTRVLVDLFRFDTPQIGTVVKPLEFTCGTYGPDLVCIHFFNPEVTERYSCNNTKCDRGYLTFSNDSLDHQFNLSMVRLAVLKANLEVTNET